MECVDEFLKEVFDAIEGYMSALGEREKGVEGAAGEQKAARDMPPLRQARP